MVAAIMLFLLFLVTSCATILLYRNKKRIDDFYEQKEAELGRVKFFLLHGSVGRWRGNSWKFFALLAAVIGLATVAVVISLLFAPQTLDPY